MKFSTGLPNCREGRQNLIGSVDAYGIKRQAQVAEECGYYALWPNEFFTTMSAVQATYADPPNLYDTIVTMSYAAAVTERIRIMPSTIVLPLHEPILLSRQIATLDAFSGGRITLGIGLGGDKEEFGRMRPDNPNRSKLMDEYMAAMNVLWTERRASYQGKYVQFTDIETYPKPTQMPLPVLRAGHGEEVFKWIARHGQGWIDSQFTPEEMKPYVGQLKTLAAEAGRGKNHFEITRQWYVSIAKTEEEAKANFAASVPPATHAPEPKPVAVPTGAHGVATSGQSAAPGRGPGGQQPRAATSAERSLVGTPEQILKRLRDYVTAGVTEMCVIFYSSNVAAVERQTRLFASEVMARW
jgi:probable F420-dependent oxidoreductase